MRSEPEGGRSLRGIIYPLLAATLILTCIGVPVLYLAGMLPKPSTVVESLPGLGTSSKDGGSGSSSKGTSDPRLEAAIAGSWRIIESSSDITLRFDEGAYQRIYNDRAAPDIKGTFRFIDDKTLEVEWVTGFGERTKARYDVQLKGKQLTLKRQGGGPTERFVKSDS